MKKNVVVYHPGARDKYSVAKFFDKKNKLLFLITDYWLRLDSVFVPKRIKNKINRRYDSQLTKLNVFSYTLTQIVFSLVIKKVSKSKFQRWVNHDKRFAKFVLSKIKSRKPNLLWGFTNANLEILEYFKNDLSILKVHNQIDPGIEYYDIQYQLWLENKNYEDQPEKLPDYFESRLRREWELADLIVVNSQYSKECLIKHGAIEKKIKILPLIYDAYKQLEPKSFGTKLNIAFVGNVSLIKGFKTFVEVAENFKNSHNFIAIGNILIKDEILKETESFITYLGQISKFELNERYKNIDLLIFPSLCDGFGMVQLEAMSYGIPVIASKKCGKVVEDGINGYIVEDKYDIINKIKSIEDNHQLLHSLSINAHKTITKFSSAEFEKKLNHILGDY